MKRKTFIPTAEELLEKPEIVEQIHKMPFELGVFFWACVVEKTPALIQHEAALEWLANNASTMQKKLKELE